VRKGDDFLGKRICGVNGGVKSLKDWGRYVECEWIEGWKYDTRIEIE
jgi:hypothetical protein